MTSYSDLLKQIEALTKEAEEIRKSEIASVITDIQKKMNDYNISIVDIKGAFASKTQQGKNKTTGRIAAKYRDPATGETWSGRGRTPKWLEKAEADGKSRKIFAISL